MDAFKNFASSQSQQDSAQQAQVWNLSSRAPQPTILFAGAVSGISTTWQLLYTASQATYVTLQEALLYNGYSGNITFRLAILNPTATAPTGSSADQANIFCAKLVPTGESWRLKFTTGLRPLWRIYGWTDAGAGVHANISLSGVEVPYQ